MRATPDRLARFRREARTLASLNHPHIEAIFGLEEDADLECLVLELAEGEALRGPRPIGRALEYARQVAEALEAAHAKGIIHRDLKPSNIKVTAEGQVKVLDCGLAKAIWGRDQNPAGLRATGPEMVTLTGHIVGTPGYMSPEQANGVEVDARSDIWAFGCLLYELLAGKRAFAGETLHDTVAAVREREPDWGALPPKTPPTITALLRRCLHKAPHRRLQSITEARVIIEQSQRRGSRWGLAGVAAGFAIMVAVGVWSWRAIDQQRNAIQVPTVTRLTTDSGLTAYPALSPDGKFLAYASDRDGSGLDRNAVWSPDGNLLYFLSERDGFRCVWAQRLNAVTKHPVGAPFEIYHFHEAKYSLMPAQEIARIGLSVTRDKLIFSMAETKGNICWPPCSETRRYRGGSGAKVYVPSQ